MLPFKCIDRPKKKGGGSNPRNPPSGSAPDNHSVDYICKIKFDWLTTWIKKWIYGIMNKGRKGLICFVNKGMLRVAVRFFCWNWYPLKLVSSQLRLMFFQKTLQNNTCEKALIFYNGNFSSKVEPLCCCYSL